MKSHDIKIHIQLIVLAICVWNGSVNADASAWNDKDNSTNTKHWSTTSVSILNGSGYKLGDNDRRIATFDHSSGAEFISNHFFFDVINPNSNFIAMYGEWHPAFNITALLNKFLFNESLNQTLLFGRIKSISIVGEYDYGTNPMSSFRSYYMGIGFDLNIPGAYYSMINIMYGGDPSVSEDTEQVSMAWSFPFHLSFLHGEFNGYIDYIGSESYRVSHLQSQPQLLFDVGRSMGIKNRLYLGVEYQYWHNKFGVKGIDEKLPQLIMTLKL